MLTGEFFFFTFVEVLFLFGIVLFKKIFVWRKPQSCMYLFYCNCQRTESLLPSPCIANNDRKIWDGEWIFFASFLRGWTSELNQWLRAHTMKYLNFHGYHHHRLRHPYCSLMNVCMYVLHKRATRKKVVSLSATLPTCRCACWWLVELGCFSFSNSLHILPYCLLWGTQYTPLKKVDCSSDECYSLLVPCAALKAIVVIYELCFFREMRIF